MLRREFLELAAMGAIRAAPAATPVVNGAEHAWVLHDARFRIDPPSRAAPAICRSTVFGALEYLLSEMRSHGVDHVVISHVCYYGRDNAYARMSSRLGRESSPRSASGRTPSA